jgi:hypothetical protein
VPTSVARPEFDAQVNVLGTVRVLAAAGDAPIVFSSTGGAIYGECPRPAREDDPLLPLSPYGIAKLAGEEYLSGWNRMHETRHTALRFAHVYGPRQEAGPEGGVVAIFLNAMAAGGETDLRRRAADARLRPRRRRRPRAAGSRRARRRVQRRQRRRDADPGAAHSSAARSRATCASRARPAREGDVLRSVLDVSLIEASSAGGSRSRSTTGCAGRGTGCVPRKEGGPAGRSERPPWITLSAPPSSSGPGARPPSSPPGSPIQLILLIGAGIVLLGKQIARTCTRRPPVRPPRSRRRSRTRRRSRRRPARSPRTRSRRSRARRRRCSS